jgi:hypothetical protein
MTSASNDSESEASHVDEDSFMDFINWDATSAGSAQSSTNPQQPSKVRNIPWWWFAFVPDPKEGIMGFKLAVEESNLLAIVTSCVIFVSACILSA